MTSSSFSSLHLKETKEPILPRFFPTATASEPNYLFVKPQERLKREEGLYDSSDRGSEQVYPCEKLRKKGDKRPETRWFLKYYGTNADSERLIRIGLAAGEIYRFQFGGPKHRLVKSKIEWNQKVYFGSLSKEIKGFIDFLHLYGGGHGPNTTHFRENMGRVLISKAVHLENDLSFENLCVSHSPQSSMTAIDSEQSFWPMTAKLHRQYQKFLGKPKEIVVDLKNIGKEGKEILFDERVVGAQAKWLKLPTCAFETIGQLSKTDYEQFPQIAHKTFYPKGWNFRFFPEFTTALAKNETFLNEKHLQAIKEIVTQPLTLEIALIHLSDKKDSADLQNLISGSLNNLLKIVSKTTSFKNYLKKNKVAALQTIFYEVKQFLEENKHYRSASQDAYKKQLSDIVTLLILQFKHLLKACHLNLSVDEELEIRDFANNFPHSLPLVFDFYHQQKMIKHALEVKTAPLYPEKMQEEKIIETARARQHEREYQEMLELRNKPLSAAPAPLSSNGIFGSFRRLAFTGLDKVLGRESIFHLT